jgi:hypothetical protein
MRNALVPSDFVPIVCLDAARRSCGSGRAFKSYRVRHDHPVAGIIGADIVGVFLDANSRLE